MKTLESSVLNVLESALKSRNTFITTVQLETAVKRILDRAEARELNGRKPFSISTAVRGMSALGGRAIVPQNSESDVNYVKALDSGVPGSYLIPVYQSATIVQQLSLGSVARAAGCRIWPLDAGVLSVTVPVALVSPNFVFLAMNSRQSPDSATNLGQMRFDLSRQQALLLLPAQLFRTSVPAWDILLEEFMAIGAGESEDEVLWASVTQSNSPVALMSQAGIQTINVSGSANGGNLAYSDILAVLEKSGTQKVRPPLAWFMAPRTLTRLLSMSDTASRPLLIPLPPTGVPGQASFTLLGWPVFLTNSISIDEAVGSGTNQSHLILCNPSAIHVAEDSKIDMAVSTDFAMDAGEIALRIGHSVSFQYQPAGGIVVLAGIN